MYVITLIVIIWYLLGTHVLFLGIIPTENPYWTHLIAFCGSFMYSICDLLSFLCFYEIIFAITSCNNFLQLFFYFTNSLFKFFLFPCYQNYQCFPLMFMLLRVLCLRNFSLTQYYLIIILYFFLKDLKFCFSYS